MGHSLVQSKEVLRMEEFLPNEQLYNEFQRLKDENYHLRRQLKNKNNLMRGKDKYIQKIERELKKLQSKKQKYKNGKRGTQFNG